MNTLIANAMTEAELQAAIVEMAMTLNYKVYHTHDSRRSPKGFPDLCMAGRRLVFAELKDEKNKATLDQEEWLAMLGWLEHKSGGLIVAKLWRPSHWLSGEIEEVLRG